MADSSVNDWVESHTPEQIKDLVRAAAKEHGVDPTLALAVAQQESGFDQHKTSEKGARGVMQLMPQTAKDLGVKIDDVKDNIKGGVRLLGENLKRYGGDTAKALWAYNAGPKSVESGKMPDETKAYIPAVQKNQTALAKTEQPKDDWVEDWQEAPAAQQQAPKQPGVLERAGRGVVRGFGLPDTAEGWKQMDPKTWADDVMNAIHDKRYGHAAAAVGEKLLGPAANPIHTGYDQLQRAADAFKAGDYNRAAIHVGVAGMQAGSFLPGVGVAVQTLPGMANAMDTAKTGDVSGGVGEGIGGAVATGLGLKAGGAVTVDPLAEAIKRTAPRAQAAKLMNEGYKPDSPIKFHSDTFDYTLPLLEEVRPHLKPNGKPLIVEDLPQARGMAMENNRVQFKAYEDEAARQGLTNNDAPIAKAMKDSISQKVRELYPEDAKKLDAEIDRTYPGKERPVGLYGSFNRTNNAVMSNFHDKLVADQNKALAASTSMAMQEAEANATRDVWYKAADRAGIGGENMRELQRRWGALKGLGDEHEKLQGRLLNLDSTKSPFSPVDLVKWLNPKGVAVDMVKKGVQKALSSVEEDPRTSVAKINQALRTYHGGDTLPPVPPPQTGPAAPLELKRTEPPATFEWQRSLFPDANQPKTPGGLPQAGSDWENLP